MVIIAKVEVDHKLARFEKVQQELADLKKKVEHDEPYLN